MPKAQKISSGGNADLWTIANVARDLGVSGAAIERASLQYCTPGSDTSDVRGVFVFTAAGLQKIRAGIGAGMAPAPVAATLRAKQPSAEASTLPTMDLTVTRIFRDSPRVLANLPNGNEVTLQVKTSALLRPGMVLAGCQFGGMGWFYYGRLPRVVGECRDYFPQPSPSP